MIALVFISRYYISVLAITYAFVEMAERAFNAYE